MEMNQKFRFAFPNLENLSQSLDDLPVISEEKGLGSKCGFHLPVPNWQQIPELIECEVQAAPSQIDMIDGYARTNFPLNTLQLTKVSLKAGKVSLTYTKTERQLSPSTDSNFSRPSSYESVHDFGTPAPQRPESPVTPLMRRLSRFRNLDLVDGIPPEVTNRTVPSMKRIQNTSRFMKCDLLPLEEVQSQDFPDMGDPSHQSTPDWLKFGRKVAMFDQRIAQATQHVLAAPEFWQFIRELGQKIIPNLPQFTPAFKQSVLNLHVYYAIDSHFSSAFYVNQSFMKTRMHVDEILILDFFHCLYALSSYFHSLYQYYKKKEAGEQTQAREFGLQESEQGDIDHSRILSFLDSFSKLLIPTSNVCLLAMLSARFRLLSQLKGIAMDFMGIFAWIARWIIDFYRDQFYGMTEGVDSWIKKVDEIEEVFVRENGETATLRAELTKSSVSRLQVLSLLSTGRQLVRKFERSNVKDSHLKPLKDRIQKLQRIISGNTASFVGCEGKMKPYTFYIHGSPGCGKTSMIPHLAMDLCTVLGEKEFDKSRDIYAVMSNTPYHDQYAYQRFAVCNDVFQMKDSDYRNTEIFNLIQMTDESPYPLNIAECTGKGTIYFASPFVLLTSNFDLMSQMPELESRMVDPMALQRRINIFIKVNEPTFDPTLNRFQRSAMSFDITLQNGRTATVGWWGLLRILQKDVKSNFMMSEGVNRLDRDTSEEAMIQSLLEEDQNLWKPVSDQGVLSQTRERSPSIESCPTEPDIKPEVEEPLVDYFAEPLSDSEPEENVGPNGEPAGPSKPYEFVEGVDGFYDACEEVQALSLRDHLPTFEDVRRLLTPLQEPPFLVRAAGGYYWPHYVISEDAQLYCDVHQRQQTAMKVLKFVGGLALGFGIWRALHKVMATIAPWDTAQMAVQVSGAEYEVRPSRGKKMVKPQFKRMDFCESKDYYGWSSSNGNKVLSMVTRNMCVVRNNSRQICGVFVFGHVLMLPQHIFQDIDSDSVSILLPHHMAIGVEMSDLHDDEVIISEARHLVFINLQRFLSIYPQFADLRQYFLEYKTDSDYISKHGYMAVLRPDAVQGAMLYQLPLMDIRPDMNEALIHDDRFNTRYKVMRTLRATVSSTVGDCGCVWILDRGENGGARLAGVHISGDRNLGMGRATIVTRAMMNQIAEQFRFGKPKTHVTNPDTQTLFKTWSEAVEQVEAIDVLGTSDVKHHQASRTQITPSPWSGIRAPLTQPAKLKKFKKDDGEVVIPQQVNALRFIGQRKYIPRQEIERALTYLSDWYPRPTKDERRILTLEQAVFGEADGWNTSIKADTSLGFPWNQHYKNRKQLFTLDPKWISREMREACHRLLKGEIDDILILDSLKDERVSLKKVQNGDTRVFMILPFHVNVVLKQLFGDFVIYLQKRWSICPVKIGISPLPQDWTKLFDYLNDNEGKLIAGDYSAWDKKVHFELMMSLVEWVNQWYDDDHGEVRLELCRKVFQCEHLIYGTIYRANCGMPSGCYLTTPFNSLANLLYWYIFILSKVPEDEMVTHTWWFRPAVYGDDHVMSVYGHPEINAQSFADWITDKGLKYTDAYKERPVTPYEPWERVQFLKRTFEHRGGYVWAPLKEEQLYDMIQWYHATPATKSLSLLNLSEQILDAVLSEVFMHGREKFEKIRDELLEYFEKRTNQKITAMPLSYKFYWDRFMTEGDKPQMWTHFTSWNVRPLMFETIQAKDNVVDPASESIQAVRETDATTVVDVHGLEQPTPAPLPNSQMVADTLISDPQAPIQDSALSQFRDAQRNDDLKIGASVTPVVDMNFVFPQGYFNLAERSLPIINIKLDTKAPIAYPCRRIDPLNVLVSKPQIANKLSNAMYVRFNMEIQIRVLATNFHYGQIMAVFRPAYMPFIKMHVDDKKTYRWFSTLQSSWAPYGPYDTVYTASQLPHSVISVTAGNSVTIQCPWSLNHQYVPVSEICEVKYHFGLLDIYMLTEMAPTDADPPTLQIFARLKDIQGFGYQFAGDCTETPPSAIIKTNRYTIGGSTYWTSLIPFYPSPTKGIVFETPLIPGNLQTLDDMGYHARVAARWNGSSIPTPKMAEQLAEEGGAKVLSWDDLNKRQKEHEKTKQKEQVQAGELSEILGTTHVSSEKSIFSAISEFIGQGIQRLGLSKPLDDTPCNRVLNVAPPIANSVGQDFTVSTAYHSQNLVPRQRHQHSEKVLIKELAATPTYLGYFKFTTTNKTMEVSIAPHTVVGCRKYQAKQSPAYQMTPAGYIASRFNFWRGSLRYWLHFSSSSFINARFLLMVSYRNISVAPGYVPTQYIEVKGDAVAEGRVPFLYHTQWANFDLADMEWTIRVELHNNALVAWKKDEATPIMCTLWVAFEDFQVAQPAINVHAGIPWGFGYYFEGNHPVSFSGMKRYSRFAPYHALVSKDPLPPVEKIPPEKPPPNKEREEIQGRDLWGWDQATDLEIVQWLSPPAIHKRSREVVQAGEVPGAIPVSESFDIGMNDIPTSLYHIMKRYQTARATLLCPFAPMFLVTEGKDLDGNYVLTFNGNVTYPAALFRWISSSVNVVSDAFNSIMDVPLFGTAYEQYVHDATLFSNEAIASLMGQYHPILKRFSEKLVAMRQPFRSNMPFVSGPHAFLSFDSTFGYKGVHFRPIHSGPYPHEGIQGLWFHYDQADPDHASFAWSFADDLCLNLFMGVPTLVNIDPASLAGALYGPQKL